MWYLWCGPLSPLFGKDRITTLENDLIADAATHVETKNPYFQLIHEVPFCDRILEEFGVDPKRGLIVNGHVPVKIEKGESPLKRSGKAITIDGAFSEAYGDHGFTLVLEPEPNAAGQTPPFRIGEGGGAGRRGHHSDVDSRSRGESAAQRSRHRTRRGDPSCRGVAGATDSGLSRKSAPARMML